MLGIFGGSFDPVHLGHIKSAIALLNCYEFEEIRFIPCQQSPLKKKAFVDVQYRWEMLNLITESNDKLTVDDLEIKRPGPSYTIDTVQEIYEKNQKKNVLVLIVGLDAYLEFCAWHKYSEILSYCHVMLLQRPGYALPKYGCEKDLYDEYVTLDIEKLLRTKNGYIFLSDIEKIDISSTTIRQIIAAEEEPKFLLPGSIWSYIKRNKLYQ